jgi:hypothetical protein
MMKLCKEKALDGKVPGQVSRTPQMQSKPHIL